MKAARLLIPLVLMFTIYVAARAVNPKAGFFFSDSVAEMTLQYKTVRDLIVLPVIINDSLRVNLILDTGCRNLMLFGKKFQKLFEIMPGKKIEFSGLGNGEPITGSLSLNNKVSIGNVLGEGIPIVIVAQKNLFGSYHNVHGVIGYDIFLKFEIEINARAQTITFRPAFKKQPPDGYSKVPLQIVDSRPVMNSRVFFNAGFNQACELMIDTGSSLGLLLKTTNIAQFSKNENETVLGIGLNGQLSGYEIVSQKLLLHGLELTTVPTGIVSSRWHDSASIGMAILKDYIVILNYCEAYVCFKRNYA